MSTEPTEPFSDKLDFISEAEAQNPWWRSNGTINLPTVGSSERSDLYSLTKAFSETALADETEADKLAHCQAFSGTSGIGKTTLLKQFINVVLESTPAELGVADRPGYELEGSLSGNQVLYLPLEESQYQLLPRKARIRQFIEVIEWFQQTQARRSPHLIIIDDIDVLSPDDPAMWKEALLDVRYDDTSLVISANTSDHAELDVPSADSYQLLPLKFSDWVEKTADKEVEDFAQARYSKDDSDNLPLVTAREGLRNGTENGPEEPGLEDCLDAFDQIYFDQQYDSVQRNLDERVQAYLYQGINSEGSEVIPEQSRADLQLYVYKSLAERYSLRNPENLFKLCAAAAVPDDEAITYAKLAADTGIDRRTLDDYFEHLESEVVLSRSHDYSLRSHREGRLYLRNPQHMVLFSQRQLRGISDWGKVETGEWNREFERAVAQQICFDHLKRLTTSKYSCYEPSDDKDEDDYDEPGHVEYAETDEGLVEFVIESENEPFLVPISLAYRGVKTPTEATAALKAFDPTEAEPSPDDDEYRSPYRIVLTDIVPRDRQEAGTLRVEEDEYSVYYLPLWLFLISI